MTGLTILEAMEDAALFRPHFRGGTWKPWRAFMAALFALPLSEGALELYRRHTGRNNAPETPFAEAALVVGRRGGKSRVLALIAVFLAAFRDYEPHLAPGEVATIAVIAADRRQARSIMRYVTGLLEAVPLLRAMVEDASGDAVQLNNRVVIEVGTASFRTTRGYSFAAVLADEVAFWRQDPAWPRSRARCCCWPRHHTPNAASSTPPSAGTMGSTAPRSWSGRRAPRR
jgi:hypothetical protein